MSTLGDQFHNLFFGDTANQFTVAHHGHNYTFERTDIEPRFAQNAPDRQDKISFRKLIETHSIWKGKNANFLLYVDGDLRMRYEYNPELIALPLLIEHGAKYEIHDIDLFFESSTIEMFEELESDLIKFLHRSYGQVFNAIPSVQ
jgi:hypothetical protein